MSSQAASVMRSKPIYATALSALPASHYLLVSQDASQAMDAELHAQLHASGLPLERVEEGADPALLEARLLELLQHARVGTRLYACGDERFLWRVYRLARSAGLVADEIELVKTGNCRELFCVHCGTQQSIGDQGTACCSGCGIQLLVREHFSRRLGAYMGVCIDPDRLYGEARP